MKRSLLAVSCCILIFSSCKEKAPVIDFGLPKGTDTTFVVTPVPPAEQHNVLVEEFTGQSCSNCPAAHEALNEIEHAHPGRVNVLGLYFEGITQTKPPVDARYDFRHGDSKLISISVYSGVNAIPAAGIDRISVNGTLKIDRSVWASTVTNRLAVETPINLKVESSFNEGDTQASITVTLVYTKTVDFAHNLSIAIVEDSMVDVQEYPSTDPVHPSKDEEYVFTNVFRGMVTAAPAGDPILSSLIVKEPGRVVVLNYKHKVTNVLSPSKCRVFAFVSSLKAGDPEIIQSAQVKMK
jgi:hypothetical protein